eukprot:g718.t1
MFFQSEISRIESSGDAKREIIEERFEELSSRVHRALALLESQSRGESASAKAINGHLTTLRSDATSNASIVAELGAKVTELFGRIDDAKMDRIEATRQQTNLSKIVQDLVRRVDEADMSGLRVQIESLRNVATSQGSDITEHMRKLSDRIATQEEHTRNALRGQRSAVMDSTKAIVERHDSALRDQNAKRQEMYETVRALSHRIESLEHALHRERNDRMESVSSLGSKLGMVLSASSSKVPSIASSGAKGGSPQRRSAAVEEILRVEIQERMSHVEQLRTRLEDLVAKISSSMERVEQNAKDSHSSLVRKFESFSGLSNRKMEALRNSTAQTVDRLARRLDAVRTSPDDENVREEDSSDARAREGSEADSPSQETWQQLDDGNGNTYFYNARTGESRWDNPYEKDISDTAVDRGEVKVIASSEVNMSGDAAGASKLFDGIETQLETTVRNIVSRSISSHRAEVTSVIDDVKSSLTSRQDEMEISMIEARQERLRLVRQHRMSVDQHEASLSLYQRTLEKHAALVIEMENERTVRQVMDSMLSSVEAAALFDQSSRANAQVRECAYRAETVCSKLRTDTEERLSSLFAAQTDHASRLDDAATAIGEVRACTNVVRERSENFISEIRKQTNRNSEKIASLEDDARESAVRETLERGIIGRLERDVVDYEKHERSTRALAQMRAGMRELDARVVSVVEKCDAIARRESEDVAAAKDNLVRAQAFLDNISNIPCPKRSDESRNAFVPRSLVTGIFPSSGGGE